MSQEFGTFFVPGPTEVRREILEAMLKPMIAHRGKAFEELFARLQTGLRSAFGTKQNVLISTSSATGLMEAAARYAPPGRILSLINGAFSERMAEMATAVGREVNVAPVEWGQAYDFAVVEKHLKAKRYAAVTVAHSETSTGVLTDIKRMTELAHAHGAMCLVDSVSGFAGAPLHFNAWELDFVFTGSQKALALPPGLAFAVASPAYLKAAQAGPRALYFDIIEFDEAASKNQTPSTPAVSLLYALEAQLEAMQREGMEKRWARHAAMQTAVERWVEQTRERMGIGLGILAPAGSRSPTVSALSLPDGVKGPALITAVHKHGITLGGGYGKLRDRTARIGHMGDHTVETVGNCVVACGAGLGEVLARTG